MNKFEKAKNEINHTIEKLERPAVHNVRSGSGKLIGKTVKYHELVFQLSKQLEVYKKKLEKELGEIDDKQVDYKKKLEKELYEIDIITKQYALDKASPYDWMNKGN